MLSQVSEFIELKKSYDHTKEIWTDTVFKST